MSGLELFYQVPLIVLKFLWMASSFLVQRDDVRPLRRRLIVALVRSTHSTLSNERSNRINPPTSKGVEMFCKSQSLHSSRIEIPVDTNLPDVPPAILHIIETNFPRDRATNRRSLFYLHGGGYMSFPSPVGQLAMAYEMACSASARYLLILEYGLTPKLVYPGQTVQAITALQFLCTKSLADVPNDVTVTGSSAHNLLASLNGTSVAENLILAGESAGAHLLLSLLAHIKFPCPYAPPIDLPRPLRAAVLLSPWVTTSYDAPSYQSNANKDFLLREKMLFADKAWKPKRDEVWADPLASAPSKTFWSDVFLGPSKIVDQTLITVGMDEIFLDDTEAFVRLIRNETNEKNVQFDRCRGEVHAGYVIDVVAGVRDGDMRTSTTQFLNRIT